MSKAQKIKQLLEAGKSPAEIAKALKTSKQYVYVIKGKMNKQHRKAIVEAIQNPPPSIWQKFVRWIKGE